MATPRDPGRTLYGRDDDLAVIGAFVDAAADSQGGVLTVIGDAGVGKSALLHAGAARAVDAGVRVLRAAGAEFEGDLRFAGLHQLLHPLLDRLTDLPGRHRDALTVALGFASGRAPARHTVTGATTALLRHASRTRPLLLAIDDLPVLDQASAEVLRSLDLAGTRIAMLTATRNDHGAWRGSAATRVHELGPLDHRSAVALLTDRFPALSPAVRGRLLAEARGNPLSLRELPAALDAAQRSGSAPLPHVLPLGRRLRAIFAARVADLPPAGLRLLLLAVLDGTGDLRALCSLLPDHVMTTALRDAREAGLIDLDRARTRLTFRHPLIRSAVVELSTAGEQRRAHEALARRIDGDEERRTWHLADAAVERDEHVADLLERLARRARGRGDVAGAVAALTRAATLSPDGRDRSRRAAAAAYLGTDTTGNLLDVPRLLEECRTPDDADATSLTTALAAAHHLLLSGNGDVDSAYRLLIKAVDAEPNQADTAHDVLREALYTLVWVGFYGARAELWEPLERVVARLSPTLHIPESLSLMTSCFGDPVHAALPDLARLDDAVGGLADADPVEVIRIGMAGKHVGRLKNCRPALQRLLEEGREGEHLTLTIHAMSLLSRHCYESGEWDRLAHLSEEGLRLSDRHGYRLLAQTFLHRQALLAATRGDTDRAEELADEITRFAAPRRVRLLLTLAAEIRTRAALARGEYEQAFRQATSVGPAGVLPHYQAPVLWLIPDLVEAAVLSGRHAEARAHVAALLRARVPAISDRSALVTRGAAAMVADDDRFVARFERALALPDAGTWPFDLARIRLFYGERLRRAKATQAAREQLDAALTTFTRLGAAPWAERARGELRASGLAAGQAGASPDIRLSPQQYEIARLAAAGLTNKQIAQRLHLSPRTVGTHLYQVFPKLDITSRAALRDALGKTAEPARIEPQEP
ncbi:AAA family ATPase (plasmid) [Embleya sp. NBC_00888]|uniref:AAA family ATPase n=1 Tax=Embleya sp. NBC_00888 TaxID=2975960 RepID=UPI002F90C6CD|nr:AAA family ATPase [Embleya sp. NBC_00888]